MHVDLRRRLSLGAFRRWLIESEKLSEGSAILYAHHVRSFLAHCIEEEGGQAYTDPDEVLAWDESRTSKARSGWRSAWRAFARYGLVVGTPPLPVEFMPDRRLGAKAEREARRQEALAPHPVMREIAAVVEGAGKLASVPGLRWGHVQAGMDNAVVHNPDVRVSFSIPMVAVHALMAWGKPERDPSRPLIPKEPGSSEPMPEHKLRAIARQAKGLTGFDGRPLETASAKT